MKLLPLAAKSAWNRRLSLSLTIISIAISVMLLLSVDKIRKDAKSSFINTIAQTDLIVGARSGPVNLLLYSVFRLGDATNNVSWESYQEIANLKQVKWTIPLSLGDSHKGFRVLGTNLDYFKHYRYAKDKSLVFESGEPFSDVFDVVLGAAVAKKLRYSLGDKIVVAHGLGSTEFTKHDDKPFRVIGILEPTGTAIDRTLHVQLEGISAIHVDWQSGRRSAIEIDAEKALKMDLQPKDITAFLVGLKNRITTFRVQRQINEYRQEPLMAVIPGSTLTQLWNLLGNFETILLAVSILVVAAGLAGLTTTVISSLNERRREMAVLRAIGAHPYDILLLFLIETLLVVTLSIMLGIALLYIALLVSQPILLDWVGINLPISPLDGEQWMILLAILLTSLIVSLFPGMIAYRRSLQDGLMIRT